MQGSVVAEYGGCRLQPTRVAASAMMSVLKQSPLMKFHWHFCVWISALIAYLLRENIKRVLIVCPWSRPWLMILIARPTLACASELFADTLSSSRLPLHGGMARVLHPVVPSVR